MDDFKNNQNYTKSLKSIGLFQLISSSIQIGISLIILYSLVDIFFLNGKLVSIQKFGSNVWLLGFSLVVSILIILLSLLTITKSKKKIHTILKNLSIKKEFSNYLHLENCLNKTEKTKGEILQIDSLDDIPSSDESKNITISLKGNITPKQIVDTLTETFLEIETEHDSSGNQPIMVSPKSVNNSNGSFQHKIFIESSPKPADRDPKKINPRLIAALALSIVGMLAFSIPIIKYQYGYHITELIKMFLLSIAGSGLFFFGRVILSKAEKHLGPIYYDSIILFADIAGTINTFGNIRTKGSQKEASNCLAEIQVALARVSSISLINDLKRELNSLSIDSETAKLEEAVKTNLNSLQSVKISYSSSRELEQKSNSSENTKSIETQKSESQDINLDNPAQIQPDSKLKEKEIIRKVYTDEPTSINEQQKQLTKICPQCAEEVKLEARICRYCRYEFTEKDNHPALAATMSGNSKVFEFNSGRNSVINEDEHEIPKAEKSTFNNYDFDSIEQQNKSEVNFSNDYSATESVSKQNFSEIISHGKKETHPSLQKPRTPEKISTLDVKMKDNEPHVVISDDDIDPVASQSRNDNSSHLLNGDNSSSGNSLDNVANYFEQKVNKHSQTISTEEDIYSDHTDKSMNHPDNDGDEDHDKGDMKKCPNCGRYVQSNAIICVYCQHELISDRDLWKVLKAL
ncbi:MAG: hypothetical protein PHR06_04405 [Candidatus Cloacimonetes bacterium]|nr:hypothetical protein [Candidatus Cloacimonadota bacterium]